MGNSTENYYDDRCCECLGSFTPSRPGLVSIGNLMTTHLDCLRDMFLDRGRLLLQNHPSGQPQTVGDEVCCLMARIESLATRMNELEVEQIDRNVSLRKLGTELDRRIAASTHSDRLEGQSPPHPAETRGLRDEMCRLSALSESIETRLNEFQVELTCIGAALVEVRSKLAPILASSPHSNGSNRLVFGNSRVGSSPDDGDQGGIHGNNEA